MPLRDCSTAGYQLLLVLGGSGTLTPLHYFCHARECDLVHETNSVEQQKETDTSSTLFTHKLEIQTHSTHRK